MTVYNFHQFRTAEKIFFFQTRDEQTLTLKIYNLSHKRIFKASAQLPRSDFKILFEKPQVVSFLKYFPSQSLAASQITSLIQDPILELDRWINLLKIQLPPIGSQLKPLISPSPTQPLEPIPTFSLFKKENSKLAKAQLQVAEIYLQEKEYPSALQAYALAFQYTQKWQDYEPLPNLFKEMKEQRKAHVALLYLTSYQIQAGALPEALKTLEKLSQDPSFSIDLRPLIIHLYITQDPKKAVSLAYKTIGDYEKEHPAKAQILYNLILHYHPYEFDTYISLASLYSNPLEESHVLLRGACQAIEIKNFSDAEVLCFKAIQQDSPLLDLYLPLQILQERGFLELFPKVFSLVEHFEARKDLKSVVKVRRYHLTLDPHPKNYVSLIQAQIERSKPQKALSWAFQGLQHYVSLKSYNLASTLAHSVLPLLSQYPPENLIPFYQLLLEIFTIQSSPKLVKVLNQLGAIYSKQGNFAQAEKYFRQAFEKLPSNSQQALFLAGALRSLPEKLSEAVQLYYEAITLLLQENNIPQLNDTLQQLLQIDPQLQHLQTAQRVQVLTCQQLCNLTQELGQTREHLQEALQLIKTQNTIQKQ